MKMLAIALATLALGNALASRAADTAKPVSARVDAQHVTAQPFELYELAVYRGKTLLSSTQLVLSPNMPGAAKSINSMSYARDCQETKAPDGTVENVVLKPEQIDSGIVASGQITPFGASKDLQLHVDATYTELKSISNNAVPPDCVVQKPVAENTHITLNTHNLAVGDRLEQSYGDKRVVLKRQG